MILASKHKTCTKDIHQRKIKTSLRKMIQKILIILYDVKPMKSKFKLHERYY